MGKLIKEAYHKMAGKKKEDGKEYNGWGGARPNSGRKKTASDRQKRSIWSTKEEYEEVKKFLADLRAKNDSKQGE